MNATQSTILRALHLARVLDVEHSSGELYAHFRAVRHELRTLAALYGLQEPELDPETTSARTGRATQPGSQRHQILEALDEAPMADFQLANQLRVDVTLIRKRRHELRAAGWVERDWDTNGDGLAYWSQTGRHNMVWRITPGGVKALARLRTGQAALWTDEELGNGSDTTPDTARDSDVSST